MNHGARELRDLQIAELEQLRARMWEIVREPPPVVDRLGRIATREDGSEVPDAAVVVNAASTIIRAGERLARLTGLDAPRRSVSVSAVLDGLSTADLAEYAEQMRLRLIASGDLPPDSPPAIQGRVESDDAA